MAQKKKQPKVDMNETGHFRVEVMDDDGNYTLYREATRRRTAQLHADNAEEDGRPVRIIKVSDDDDPENW